MKDRKYIQQLLDRFVEGMTSEQEERQLADFFASTEDIPEEWRAYAIMFGGFQQKSVLKRQPSKVLPLKRWVAVAACAAGFVAFFLVLQRTVKDEQQLALEEPMVKEQQIASQAVPPAPETLVEDLVEVKSSVKPNKAPKRKRVVPQEPIEVPPVLTEAEPIKEELEQENAYLPQQPDPYLLAVAETQDIRSRGEHLYQEINQILINAKK